MGFGVLWVLVYPYGGVVGLGVPIRGFVGMGLGCCGSWGTHREVVGMGLGCCGCWCTHKGVMCLCVPIRGGCGSWCAHKGSCGYGFGVLWVLWNP